MQIVRLISIRKAIICLYPNPIKLTLGQINTHTNTQSHATQEVLTCSLYMARLSRWYNSTNISGQYWMINCHLMQTQTLYMPKRTNPCIFIGNPGVLMDFSFMEMFYSCLFESISTYSFICRFGSLTFKNRKRLEHIVRLCSKITGMTFQNLANLESHNEGKSRCGRLHSPAL